ncbi:acyl-CoA dehydrogenase family protein [Aquabacterium sp.]|uniref:acyl-CoA dehydrogenase family protein n=1 Tax=Aquabacterium sp. TaxID=1872578 RepID=UPI002CF68C07|nr:acyl-CoA dehydrogenase family protein [Aquabacterium sp.]HSW05240.1 acyl-CoA dehydrogenase family protein [Aquabacterium sp.]
MTTDNDTVEMLRDAAQRYAAEQYGFAQRRTFLAAGCSEQAWRDYAEFGWLSLRLPEADGGIDADATAIGALMEVVGARLLMEPVLASAVLGTGLVLASASAAQRAELLPVLAEGALTLAFACDDDPTAGPACELRGERLHGGKINVLHGDVAGRLIVSARDADAAGGWALCLVDPAAAGVERKAYRLIDGRGAATLHFQAARVERLGTADAADAAEAIARARDEAAVALCAETLGVVRSLVTATCDYLKVRKQFGRTIGSNQALQHRMVELFLLQQEIEALTRVAQRSLDANPTQRVRTVSGARAYIAGAARRVANDAVQMHGGLGITEELDISHYFRRVMVINALFGNRDEHFARYVEAAR